MAADGNPNVNSETRNDPNSREGGEGVELEEVGEREMGEVEREIFLQVELHADEDNDSTEIKQKKRMARTALAMWKEYINQFSDLILLKRSEARRIMNEVYNLVSLYNVFEGVVLTAVATSDRLECQHLWSPITLSLFVYSVLVVVAFTKFKQIWTIQYVIQLENQFLRECINQVLHWKRCGYADFDFGRDCLPRRKSLREVPFWRSALLFVVLLTMFTTGLVFSFVHILCWS